MRPEKRRLNERYSVNRNAILRYSGESLADCPPIPVEITDVSRDSLGIMLSGVSQIAAGTEVMLDLSDSDFSQLIQGKVSSCIHKDGRTKIGVSLNIDKTDILTVLKSNTIAALLPTVDRRNGDRRARNITNDDKRKFERRGLWTGLLTKRSLAEYIWGLKKNDVYFFAKPLESAVGRTVRFGGREMIMMASNNYLGLNTHPKVKEAAIDAIHKYGTGSSGSNIVGGTYDIHIELEDALAKLVKTEAVVICPSGYVANTATLTTVLGKEDSVFNDALNHASLIDGSLRNGAYSRIFHHNDMKDLEKKLSSCERVHKLVVADAVFSMDGDLAPLPEMFRLCKKYNAALMLDQAHATGVFGETGAGLLEHFNMNGKADIVVGTLSKSLAAVGGFIGGSKELVNILRHSGRQIFFSTSISPSACASILAALRVMQEEPELRHALLRNAEHLRSGLQAMGFNTGTSQSPIIPVIFPIEDQTNNMAKALLAQDIYVTPIPYPAVKKNQTRIRITVIATHTPQDIERTLAAFKYAKAKVLG